MRRLKRFAALIFGALAIFCLAAQPAWAGLAEDVVSLTNGERARKGLPKLRVDGRLMEASAERAKESAVLYSHDRPDGTDFDTVFDEYQIDYRQCGENMYYDTYNNVSGNRMIKSWMDSPGHRDNILNPNFTHIGVGVHSANGTNYGVQLFLGK